VARGRGGGRPTAAQFRGGISRATSVISSSAGSGSKGGGCATPSRRRSGGGTGSSSRERAPAVPPPRLGRALGGPPLVRLRAVARSPAGAVAAAVARVAVPAAPGAATATGLSARRRGSRSKADGRSAEGSIFDFPVSSSEDEDRGP
jgi:hypothetical protein